MDENKYLKKLKVELVKSEYENKIKGQIREPEQLHEVFSSLKNKAQETLIAVYLDNNLEVLAYNVLSTGSKSETVIDFWDVYGYGFMIRAKYFVLIHNHPSGDPKPTKDDKKVLDEIRKDYSRVALRMLDFIIIGDAEMNESKKDYWSMFEEMDGGEYTLGNV